MPTVLRWGAYRAFFYSNEGGEPAQFTSVPAAKKSKSGSMISPSP